MDYLGILFGIILLSYGGDLLTKSSIDISLKFSVPKIIIGMTVVSFATSAPELIVSLNATLDGLPSFAIGNVLGSNIANIGLVLGIITIIYPITLKQRFYYTDFPLLMISTALFYFIIYTDNQISRTEGFILLISITAILFYLFIYQKKSISEFSEEIDNNKISITKSFMYIIFSGSLLWLGSETLIKSAVTVANKFEISERVISITMVAIGTSIPELAASIVASLKKQNDLSIGNLIGSNIFNLLVVIGVTSSIIPIGGIQNSVIFNDMLWVVLFSAIILPLAYFGKRNVLTRKKGIILLILYLIFIIPLLS
ncbi:calcium/sodium antiporter [Flavobacteriaceae bacterium]|nr:calcium/sodium antiporter [Flavobacteriaceae bacterium]MDA9276737.1 calcium/sodium antiporter [Flavobacteriaceae bacterium]MDB2366303.1 calcium/sodium antiporter [Flavobacteriaceae bacterium]MDB3873948.1 calcium/sodium antiporter [Flavobacteriaceae bacterium]MDC0560072.1 calcium/sodium antiporter [Flavobacteriaceae bacterium]